jgi:tetratricopeptide (TPR) repeat protein
MNAPNPTAIDEYLLDNVANDNDIDAEFFVPFVRLRLSPTNGDENAARLSVQLDDINAEGSQQRTLHLSWSQLPRQTENLPIQTKLITELAACGIACVLVPRYAKMRVLFTAQEGDRFDYWIGDDLRQWGLEVSGTIRDELNPRHRAKVEQLLSNPFGVDGYVAVTKFSTRESIFSFHRYRREDTMTPTPDGSISREGLSSDYKQNEKEASRLILEANVLKSAGDHKQAAQKFAKAAELELKNTDELSALGLLDNYFIHRFSAASCLAQAGNLYQAMQLCSELLSDFPLSPPLHQRIAGYLQVLETRMSQWMSTYAPDVVAAAD